MGIVINCARRVLWTIPYINVEVYNFGFWFAINFIVCWILCQHDFARKRLKADAAVVVSTAIICGAGGGRLTMMAMEGSFNGDFSAGLSFQGGVVCAVGGLTAYYYLVGQRLPPAHDSGATILPMGHAVGKLGCFFSGDGCYGTKTSMPWGMSFPNGMVPTTAFVHPTPLYEATLSFLIWAYLWKRRTTMKRDMDNVFAMIILLSGSRVIMESVRDHPVEWYGMSVYQMWALVGVAIGVVLRTTSRMLNLFDEPEDVRELREQEERKNA